MRSDYHPLIGVTYNFLAHCGHQLRSLFKCRAFARSFIGLNISLAEGDFIANQSSFSLPFLH